MKKYWIGFAAVISISFAVLGWVGSRIYQQAPPIADRVITTDGTVIIPSGDISAGQNVWQAMGGMEVGSVWGHGSYVAPDWSADWLHRELVFILDEWSNREFGSAYGSATLEQQAQLKARLTTMVRTNTYDERTNTIVLDPVRARAFEANLAYYTDVFINGRKDYAVHANSISGPEKMRQFAAFIFWSSWAASTNRPDDNVTYTSNWPHEDLIGNVPTGDAVVWTGVSIIMLLAGIGTLAWFRAAKKEEEPLGDIPDSDPLLHAAATPSQKATLKYFWTVLGLLLLQMGMGIVTAHYGVEGDGFYGIPLAKILPYSVARTWHTQLGIFWIATAWLAAGLFIGPAVSGAEPKGQRLGVNVLFGALLVVVLGSMAGEWLSIMNILPDDLWFYFGHSGYEYIDLGRFFQIALLAGLLLWFFLMFRSIRPALARRDEQRPILVLFLISSAAIASFYAAALMYGKHTNLAVAEYWRWWVVHLWVEGFFEVFASVVIAFLFARLKLIHLRSAAQAAALTATIYLSGGIIGTLHHLYFAGTPTVVLALGSVFSALEIVPLVFVGFEAMENLKIARLRPWISAYRWPIYFFVAVAFWNLVGAGLFGFMINPPIALYYMQGLNTTPVHGHAALFGVYGMLGIGLLLFCLRAMNPSVEWNGRMIGFAFWGINIGLFSMVTLSLLPVGLMQTWASVEYGYWYARSAEFLQTDLMHTFRWMRVFGDTIFAVGIVALVLFVGKLTLSKVKN
ncbi:MAG: nitric-oxide reductase large subunit [Bacteroidetes bacterium]|nr:nitric-oxide reductase large subunit [Bacteroidota bacterium]